AHSAMGTVLAFQREWGAAEREFKRAIELDPRNATAQYFYGLDVLSHTGRLDEGIAEVRKSLEIDPLALAVNANLGRLYFFQRKYDRAWQQPRRTQEIEPGWPVAHVQIVELYESQGIYEKAIEESRSLVGLRPYQPGVNRDSPEFLRRGFVNGGAK